MKKKGKSMAKGSTLGEQLGGQIRSCVVMANKSADLGITNMKNHYVADALYWFMLWSREYGVTTEQVKSMVDFYATEQMKIDFEKGDQHDRNAD